MNYRAAILLAFFALAGCRGFHPWPSLERSGDFYSTTRDYTTRRVENGEDFCGLGKAMVQGGWTGGQAAMISLPLPTLLLAYPLMWVERVTVCPLVDTVMIPYDLYARHRLAREAEEGLSVEVVDAWGRPVPDLDIVFFANEYAFSEGVYYDGTMQKDGVATVRRTDADGRCRFPVARSTYYTDRLDASAWTTEGKYEARPVPGYEYGPVRKLKLEPVKGDRTYKPTFTPTDPSAPRLPPPAGVELVRGEGAPPMLGTYREAASAYLANTYYGAKQAVRPADFDDYWEAELKRLDHEVPFAVDVRPLPEASTGALEVCSVAFPSFGRKVEGRLWRPRDGARHPVRIRVPSHRHEDNLGSESVRDDEVTLVLDVHHDQELPDHRIRERNGFWTSLSVTAYAVDGIDRSREEYFFHPFILGAVRAVKWLLDEPYADATCVEAEGIGQGGGMGLWLMAFEPRIGSGRFVNPSHLMQHREGRCSWPGLLYWSGREAGRRKARATPSVPYFETLNFATRIHGKVRLASAGKQSYDLSSDECVVSLFRALPDAADKKLFICPEMTTCEALQHLRSREEN